MNEGMMGNTTYTGNALALQPGNYGYCIMDAKILKNYKKNGPDIFDIVHPEDAFLAVDAEFDRAEEEGYDGFIRADSIEELAEKAGVSDATVVRFCRSVKTRIPVSSRIVPVTTASRR